MVRDHGAVAIAAVEPTVDLRLRDRSPGWRADDAESHGSAERARPITRAGAVGAAAPGAGQLPHPPEAVVEVTVDVEVAGDVGAGQADLVGTPQEAPQGAAVPQHQRRCVGGSDLAAVPGAEANGELAPDEGACSDGELLGDRA